VANYFENDVPNQLLRMLFYTLAGQGLLCFTLIRPAA